MTRKGIVAGEPDHTGLGWRSQAQEVEETVVYPVVRFTTADGQVVQFQAAQNSNPPHHRIGGSVSILYDPGNPQQVEFDTCEIEPSAEAQAGVANRAKV